LTVIPFLADDRLLAHLKAASPLVVLEERKGLLTEVTIYYENAGRWGITSDLYTPIQCLDPRYLANFVEDTKCTNKVYPWYTQGKCNKIFKHYVLWWIQPVLS
jgi:hypothetical protein